MNREASLLTDNENLLEGLLRGIPVSEGIAIGKVWLVKSVWDEVVPVSVKKKEAAQEVERYRQAVAEVKQQLIECRDRVRQEIGEEEAQIFEVHLTLLDDGFFREEIPAAVQKQRKNVEHLLREGVEQVGQSFARMKNAYFRERITDVRDVALRILRVLLRSDEARLSLKDSTVLVAHDLMPSDTARIDREKIVGFVTEMGGKTSHASIIARSMGLPAVVGVEKLMRKTNSGDAIVVDGNSGIVYVNPPQRVLKGYQKRKQQFDTYRKRLKAEAGFPAVTTDDVNVLLQANVSMTADVSLAVRYNADGIGLFRTELPFLIAGKLLSEEEQFKIYRTIVETMGNKTVTIRTLDLGGDKFLPFQGVEEESNPFLGWRSIRIFLQERDVFKTQLRAILRASHFGNVRILFPMISSLDEILEIREVVDEVKTELRGEGVPFDENIQCGIMIEVPSAAILANQLIEYTDYFSIGTNDLIQYTLAVDRNNEKVAKFYQPLNPSVLSLIYMTIQAALLAGKPVSLCGEMAGNPIYTALLLGFGLRQFSMSPLMLTEVRERVRVVSIEECEAVSDQVLQMKTAEQVEEILWDFHRRVDKKQSIPYFRGVGDEVFANDSSRAG